jgi:hypothetical protein
MSVKTFSFVERLEQLRRNIREESDKNDYEYESIRTTIIASVTAHQRFIRTFDATHSNTRQWSKWIPLGSIISGTLCACDEKNRLELEFDSKTHGPSTAWQKYIRKIGFCVFANGLTDLTVGLIVEFCEEYIKSIANPLMGLVAGALAGFVTNIIYDSIRQLSGYSKHNGFAPQEMLKSIINIVAQSALASALSGWAFLITSIICIFILSYVYNKIHDRSKVSWTWSDMFTG